MTVEERRRVELYRRLSATLGEEAATTLSDLLPPQGDELATRSDVRELEARIDRLEERTTASMHELELRLTGAMGEMDQRLTAAMGEMDQRLTSAMGEMDQRHRASLSHIDERHDTTLRAVAAELSGTIDRRISAAVTTQTRTLVLSQLAALVTIAALAFGLS